MKKSNKEQVKQPDKTVFEVFEKAKKQIKNYEKIVNNDFLTLKENNVKYSNHNWEKPLTISLENKMPSKFLYEFLYEY